MPRHARLFVLPLLFAPASCLMRLPVEETVYSPCQAVSSSDWKAHVERHPTRHNRPILKRMLVVEGKVTVPGPGYDVSLDLGPVDKLEVKIQQIIVRTRGEGAGAPEVRTVRGVFPARKRYGGLRIRCGDGTLAVVNEVPEQPYVKD